MQITGSYSNYMAMTGLLAPMGVKDSGELVMQVFSSAIENLQGKIDEQIFSKESNVALKGLYSKVSDLAAQAQKLTQTDYGSVFYDRAGVSSSPNVLTAEADDAFSQDSGAAEATYQITVDQLAGTQENTGLALAKDEETGVNVGANTFSVNIGGEAHELSIDVESGDTNEMVLEKMVSAINNAEIGVGAKIAAGTGEDSQKLMVTADETGTENAFSISDLSGNAVGAAGIDTISTAAQNATYAVDGTNFTSQTNTVYLNDGFVTVTLKGTGDATLTIAPDPAKVKNAVTSLVSGVNSFVDFLESNSDYINDDVLATIKGFIADHKANLEAIGIAEADDGQLVVDTAKLTTTVADDLGGIEETFGGLDGLAVQLKTYASQVATDSPLNHAKEAEGLGNNFADYFHGASAKMLQNILQGALLNTFV